MEEWVGERLHRLIMRVADPSFMEAAVPLEDVTRAVELLFRAAGGDAAVRVATASAQKIGGRRSWVQKIAGYGERAAVTSLDGETLALPPTIAVFDSRELNRALYLWLAALAASHETTSAGWLADNVAAARRALRTYPGLRVRFCRLVDAHLAQRTPPEKIKSTAGQRAERAIVQTLKALRDFAAAGPQSPAWSDPAQPLPGVPENTAIVHAVDTAPVWLWLLHAAPPPAGPARDDDPDAARPRNNKHTQQDNKRRRASRTQDTSNRNGLMMFFRAESILSWGEFVRVNRAGDDQDDHDATKVADDKDELARDKGGETLDAHVKFDLDLPSAAWDDLPVGEGEPLPEWDFKAHTLRPDVCRAQRLRPRAEDKTAEASAEKASGTTADTAQQAAQAQSGDDPKKREPSAIDRYKLRATERQVRRRFEALRAGPRWLHGLLQGEELDLDAWVRFRVDHHGSRHSESPPIFSQRMRTERSLASVVLADISLSTDAYATQDDRVIDLIRDSLLVFGGALDSVGDPFEMLGFSSVRRNVRIHELKRFGESWDTAAQERVAAIKPGYYTRMGAAIRHGTKRLSQRPERQRLLLILSDGKPNDLDQYEGRYGLEDTRHAVHEARQAGLVPFCVTIDQQAHDYLPHLFGSRGFALIHRPEQLARALTQVYVKLTAAAR